MGRRLLRIKAIKELLIPRITVKISIIYLSCGQHGNSNVNNLDGDSILLLKDKYIYMYLFLSIYSLHH